MTTRTRKGAEEEKPDPIRRAAAKVADVDVHPPEEKVAKQAKGASTGAPTAGRSTLEQARGRGVVGLLQVLGPGLVTGASDDDPSGIGTYSQAGSQFGLATLWLALFTFPLMVAVQEACGASHCTPAPAWARCCAGSSPLGW
jgi:hypothetical protein